MARKSTAKKSTPGSRPSFTDATWPIGDLKPFERNPREHDAEHVSKIARSISEFGFTVPVLIDPEGEIIAGHGRLLASKVLGLTEIPVRIAQGLTDAQKRAYRIADNQLTIDGGWNEADLSFEIKALDESGFDLSLTGFEPVIVDAYLRGANGPSDDGIPEPPEGSYKSQFGVIVVNETEEEQEETYQTLAKLGYNCRVVVT